MRIRDIYKGMLSDAMLAEKRAQERERSDNISKIKEDIDTLILGTQDEEILSRLNRVKLLVDLL